MRNNLFRAFFATLLTLSVVSCSKPKEEQPKVSVVIHPVTMEYLPFSHTAVGQIVPIENVYVVARVRGFLTKRLFEPGAFVKKGQLLFEIQKDQYVAQVQKAKAELVKAQATYDNALIEFNRQSVLYKQNATSQESLDTATQNKLIAEGNLGVAQADLELQELNLSYTDIFAPFDGRIGMYNYSVGNEVSQASDPLAQVIMVDPIWVEFPINEKHLQTLMDIEHVIPSEMNESFLSFKDNVRLILSNGTKYPLIGAIDYISNQIDPLAGTIESRAIFKNPDEKLVPGGYATVKVETIKKFPKLMIMQIAMQEDQLGTFVYIVTKDNIVVKKYIKKGEVTDNIRIVVEEGLKEGEMVIIGGVLRVKPGMKVDRAILNPNVDITALIPSEKFDSLRADTSKTESSKK